MKSNDWRHKNVAPYTPGNTKILYFFNCLLDGMHTIAGFTVTFNFFFAPTSSVAFFAIVIFFAFTAAFVLSIVTGDAKTDTAIINAITNAVTFPLFIFLLLLYRFASFIVFSSCTIMNFTLYIACSSTHFDKIVSKSLYFHEILYKTLHDLYFSFTLDNIWISDLSG